MKKLAALAVMAASAIYFSGSASAATIVWSDLISRPTANSVVGTMGATTVTFTGSLAGVELGAGKNYWQPFPSAEGPVESDFIALGEGGLKTISFSSPVSTVYLALMSWDVPNTSFSIPFTVVAEGCGAFGCGSAIVGGGGTHLTGVDELHGILRFSGPVTSFSFVDDTEFRHVIQIGIGAIPEPETWATMIAGFALTGLTMRRLRAQARRQLA